jgi:hypothetical protein
MSFLTSLENTSYARRIVDDMKRRRPKRQRKVRNSKDEDVYVDISDDDDEYKKINFMTRTNYPPNNRIDNDRVLPSNQARFVNQSLRHLLSAVDPYQRQFRELQELVQPIELRQSSDFSTGIMYLYCSSKFCFSRGLFTCYYVDSVSSFNLVSIREELADFFIPDVCGIIFGYYKWWKDEHVTPKQILDDVKSHFICQNCSERKRVSEAHHGNV